MELVKTKKWLKQNGIKAVPGDKSNRFTLMKKTEYKMKMKDILSSQSLKSFQN